MTKTVPKREEMNREILHQAGYDHSLVTYPNLSYFKLKFLCETTRKLGIFARTSLLLSLDATETPLSTCLSSSFSNIKTKLSQRYKEQ